jgi:dipeptidyl aminopeptidase/acylaminoacyl peptidase
VGDPKVDREMLVRNSPVAQAANIKAPLFLAYGEDDLRVPLAHGQRMRDALTKAGNPPQEWVVYPDEGHGWRQRSVQLDFADRLERFLGQNLMKR